MQEEEQFVWDDAKSQPAAEEAGPEAHAVETALVSFQNITLWRGRIRGPVRSRPGNAAGADVLSGSGSV